MIDNKYLRNNLEYIANLLKKRNFSLEIDHLSALESERKDLQSATEQLQAERNAGAKSIGQAKARGEDITPLLARANTLSETLKAHAARLSAIQTEWDTIVQGIPNILHDSVPAGHNEADNQEVRRWKEPTSFDFTPKDHVALGMQLSQMDFETAAKVTGSRFVILYDQLAKLHRALIQFMLDMHTQNHGYREIYTPFLVNSASMFGTGQLPKFGEDSFRTEKHDYWLVPTAEVSVTNTVRDVILEADQLPLQMVAHTPCFRSEVGAYGKDKHGMIRQHQFEKVELVHIVEPEKSYEALETIVGHAEAILQALELPYRVVVLCAGDTGFSAAKTYDLEVWLPGEQQYREISSCSNFEAFQARRMQARWRNPATGKPELVHTLNGSGLPAGRTMIAIMENFQDAQGHIHIPEVLQPYMSGQKKIG